MSSQIKIRLLKFWQTENGTLVWKINPFDSTNKDRYPKTAYLVLSTSPSTHFTVSCNKPTNINQSGPFVTLLRKHASAGRLMEVSTLTFQNTEETRSFKDNENTGSVKSFTKGTAFVFSANGQLHKVVLEDSRPPTISFITGSPPLSLCRLTPKASYTKKQTPKEYLVDSMVSFEVLLAPIELHSDTSDIHENLQNPPESSESSESSEYEENTIFSRYQRESLKRLKRRKKTLTKSLTKIHSEQVSKNDVEALKNNAKLLQSYAYLAKPGDFALTLNSSTTGFPETITIELDPDKSIGENIEGYFIASKKSAKKLLSDETRLSKLKSEIHNFEKLIEKLGLTVLQDSEIDSLLDSLQINRKSSAISKKFPSSHSGKSPYRKYQTAEGNIYYVGRSAKENDELTKSAKSNDFWVHTSEIPGSHVIIPARTLKNNALSQIQLREAGMLSIHFSKLRESRSGEVYHTFRRNLRKTKGLPPGLWIVDSSPTAVIKYSEKEIRELLNTMVTE